jgi:hypothetical protein
MILNPHPGGSSYTSLKRAHEMVYARGIAEFVSAREIRILPLPWVRRQRAIEAEKRVPCKPERGVSAIGYNRDQKVHYREKLAVGTQITLKKWNPVLAAWCRWRDSEGFNPGRWNEDSVRAPWIPRVL